MNRSELLPIEDEVYNQLLKSFGKKSLPRLIVGVSGGADSMALLHILCALSVPVYIIHINYQKRGAESDEDARLVAQTARELGIGFAVHKADPSKAEGKNFQQWARNYRYNLFKEAEAEQNADGIAVAHHRDDQIETVVQKIFRGGGLVSWSGMSVWDGQIFRPLLHKTRNDIEQYLEQKAIPYRTDRSNLRSEFARNFLRNEWLVRLEDFFPGWEENVLRITNQAGLYEHALEWIARTIDGEKGIDRGLFHSLKSGLQKAVVLELLKTKDPDIDVSRGSLVQLNKLEELQTGQSIRLTDRYIMLRDRDFYRLIELNNSDTEEYTVKLSDLDSPKRIKGLELSVVTIGEPAISDKSSLYLDIDKIAWPINIRSWQDGDRFQPLGMSGHQLVSDHLTNRKVSAAYRKQAILIESFEETICALIFPLIKNELSAGTISEQVKWEADTRRCLKIKPIKSS